MHHVIRSGSLLTGLSLLALCTTLGCGDDPSSGDRPGNASAAGGQGSGAGGQPYGAGGAALGAGGLVGAGGSSPGAGGGLVGGGGVSLGAGGFDGAAGSIGAGGDGAAGSIGAGGDGAGGTDGAGGASPGAFVDPGTGPWVPVPEGEVAATCGLDPANLRTANTRINTRYAIVRHGRLCHEYNPTPDAAAEVWSAPKTLGAVVTGIASYETRDIPRTGRKTGQLKDSDRADHWLDGITFNREAHIAHVLAMVGHGSNLARPTYSYDTIGAVQINRLSDAVNAAIAQDPTRLGRNIEELTQRYLYEAIGMTDSRWTNGSANKTYAYSWSATLRDMARVGLLVLHRGMWSGRRILDESWVYGMIHPAFETANTAYGYLTWLNARTGGTGPGGAGTGTGTGGDPCAPAAVWQSYPHGLSSATSCTFTAPHVCTQDFDVGVWSAQGLGGQFIVGHAGLDLVIVAKNYSGGGGPTGLWQHIRPALVALDATYAGNETAFCAAYGANAYAPNLIGTVTQPPWP